LSSPRSGHMMQAYRDRPETAAILNALLDAALQGTGIALLPEEFGAVGIASGKLEWVLQDWSTAEGILHFLYPSRRGLLPAVRAFVDFLAERLPPARAARLEKCKEAGRATMPGV